jgi:hypothetical protein
MNNNCGHFNRRQFLQGVSATGALAISPHSAVTGKRAARSMPAAATEGAATRVVAELENEFLFFQQRGDASAVIRDKQTGCEWRMGPVALQEDSEIDVGAVWMRNGRSVCEQFPGRFGGVREGGGVRFWMLGRHGEVAGSFLTETRLDGRWLEFSITQIDDSIPSLSFPPSVECESLVLPSNLGRWVKKPVEERQFLNFLGRLNMRWFGGLKGDCGYLALVPQPNFVDGGVMLAQMAAAPVWLRQLGQWSEPRTVRYRFVRGNYVQLALEYREWARAHGLLRPLKEKAEACPALNHLLQGRIVSIVEAIPRHGPAYYEDLLAPASNTRNLGQGAKVLWTHDQVASLLPQLPDYGIDQALVVVRGWIPGGYDWSHPDVWPPEPALGSIADLKRLCGAEPRFPVALHDNYQDIYEHSPSWPRGIVQQANGELLAGGYWEGGQAYILTAAAGRIYAERNWEGLRQPGLRALYVDTTSAVQTYQSYAPGARQSRAEDVAGKIRLLEFFKAQGLVLGSEEGADFAVPHLDWNENRHVRVPGESVPLWPLVFHDAVVSGRYPGDPQAPGDSVAGGTGVNPEHPPWLLDMLWGYAVFTSLQDPENAPSELARSRDRLPADAWFRRVSVAAMIDHAFLDEDGNVERTRFSNGLGIVVNFSSREQPVGGRNIPAGGFVIEE